MVCTRARADAEADDGYKRGARDQAGRLGGWDVARPQPWRPVEINLLGFTKNLLEVTDGLRRGGGGDAIHQQTSRCGSLRPSIYADVGCIDDVIAIEGHYSTPHIFTATNWSDPTSYRWDSKPLFSDKVVKGGIEDMFLWVDARGGYHAIFHLMYGCGTCGSHAYSSDGQSA